MKTESKASRNALAKTFLQISAIIVFTIVSTAIVATTVGHQIIAMNWSY